MPVKIRQRFDKYRRLMRRKHELAFIRRANYCRSRKSAVNMAKRRCREAFIRV